MKKNIIIIIFYLFINSCVNSNNQNTLINIDSLLNNIVYNNIPNIFNHYQIIPDTRNYKYIEVEYFDNDCNTILKESFYHFESIYPEKMELHYDTLKNDSIKNIINYHHELFRKMLEYNLISIYNSCENYYTTYFLSVYDSTFDDIIKKDSSYYDFYYNSYLENLSLKEKKANKQYRFVLVNLYNDTMDYSLVVTKLSKIRPVYRLNDNWLYYRSIEFSAWDSINCLLENK